MAEACHDRERERESERERVRVREREGKTLSRQYIKFYIQHLFAYD